MTEIELAEKKMVEQYETLIRDFESIAKDIHLPFLDAKLYRKYFVETKSPERLVQLKAVVDSMAEHRLQTVRLLKLIGEREALLRQIHDRTEKFGENTLGTLETQTQVLQLLYKHQQITLKIVEGVASWRSLLTHDYPFMWKGKNYLLKIADDCKWIDESPLHKILPLRVSEFPLCSNISSLSLFSSDSAPGGPQHKKQPHAVDAARLRSAEALVHCDGENQERLMKQLHAKSASGCFVTLLRHDFIPNCATGIRVSKEEWGQRYREALEDAVIESQRAVKTESEPVPKNTSDDHRSLTPSSSSSRTSTPRSTRLNDSSENKTPKNNDAEAAIPQTGTVSVEQNAEPSPAKSNSSFEKDSN